MRAWVRLFLLLFPVLPVAAEEHVEAKALFAARRYGEAQLQFEQAVTRNPNDVEAHHYLGRLARLRQEFDVAIDHLERAAELRPDDAAIQHDLGVVCALHADTLGFTFRAASLARRGRQAMERSVALAPGVVLYHRGLLEFHRRAPRFVGGSRAQAYASADAMAELDPFAGAVARTDLLLEDERAAEAVALWARFLEDSPQHPGAWYQLGLTAALSGAATDLGIAALRRCLEAAEPPEGVTEAQVQWRLGQLLARRNDHAGAEAAYRRALQLDPGNAALARDLARLGKER